MNRYKIAIDIGGTFTDGIMHDAETGTIWLEKALTTPADPGEAVSKVAHALLVQKPDSDRPTASMIDDVMHATTLVTNAIIERKGARTGLVVTKGFADTLSLRREDRYDLYDLDIAFPDPLVSIEDTIELDARMAADGSELVAIDSSELVRAVTSLKTGGVDAVAVCLLHSYVDASHEETVAEAIRTHSPKIYTSVSSQIAREIREYERMSTTAANAYVQPLTSHYLDSLNARLADEGITAPLRIMVSSGGFTSADSAAQTPVRLLESGPAAGVLSAVNTASCADIREVLAFDMGGTTAKLCVAVGGRPEITSEFEAGRVRRFKKGSGLPVMVPSIDMIEIGAGGGSIAHVGNLELLNVGPESSGAEPGPACYGQGGTQPTVTDADLLLGYLDPDNFLGGAMALSTDAACTAIDDLARELSMTAEVVAFGINDLVNENMAAAARVHIAEKGLDPRNFTMVATGGAGPVHAVEVANKLGLKRVLSPIAAGNGSCLGLLVAPPRVDRAWSKPEAISVADWADAQIRLDAAYKDCQAELQNTRSDDVPIAWSLSLEMRYEGQGDTITVPFEFGPVDEAVKPCAAESFSATYARLYGRTLPSTPVEIVTWRLIGTTDLRTSTFNIATASDAKPDPVGTMRAIYLPEIREKRNVPVYDRYALAPGSQLEGPLILQEPQSTVVVARNATVTILQDGTVSIELP